MQARQYVDLTTSTAGAAIGALRAEQGPDAPAVVALEKAYVDATRDVGLVASGLVLLGLLASFSLGGNGSRSVEPATEEPAQEH